MAWDKIYRVRSYLRSSLWVIPFFAISLELVATRVIHWSDRALEWKFLDFGADGAQALFQAVVSATLTFIVFTFGSLLVAIQVASSQLTARIIAATPLTNGAAADVPEHVVPSGLSGFGMAGRLSPGAQISTDEP